MYQKIVEIEIEHTVKWPMTREQAKRYRKKKRTDRLLGILTVAMLVGILLLAMSGLVQAVWAPEVAVDAERKQVTGKLEVPSAEVLYAIEAMEKILPQQVSVKAQACAFSEKTHAWDVPLTEEELEALLEACDAGHIHPSIGLGLIQVESSFNPDAVNSRSGCYGYCQLNPRYFPSDLSPVENIRTGIGYLAEQLVRYDNLEAALTAYNAGEDTGKREYAEMVLAAAERWQ